MKELKKHPELTREETRLFLANLNQAGAITVLDLLDATQAGQLCAKLMEEVSHIPCLKEGSTFKIYHNITGKPYGPEFKVIHGKATALGKPIITKPQFLIGKKEGSTVTISNQVYVIKDIDQTT